MKQLNNQELLEVNGGEGIIEGYFVGKIIDYVIDNRPKTDYARRAYGSKWACGDDIVSRIK